MNYQGGKSLFVGRDFPISNKILIFVCLKIGIYEIF